MKYCFNCFLYNVLFSNPPLAVLSSANFEAYLISYFFKENYFLHLIRCELQDKRYGSRTGEITYCGQSVLRQCISHYGLSSQGLLLHKNWECTVKISRSLGYSPNKLSNCCARFNIDLKHHEALSDARACAKLYLNLNKLQNQQR